MARLLSVSRSGYYEYRKRCRATTLTAQKQRQEDLTVKILTHHRESEGTYGAPRITADLREAGEQVTEKTVAKIMTQVGIEGIAHARSKSPRLRSTRTRHSRRIWSGDSSTRAV